MIANYGFRVLDIDCLQDWPQVCLSNASIPTQGLKRLIPCVLGSIYKSQFQII